jgi:hypothetical protein
MKTLIAIASVLALTGCGIPYSDGARVGTVQKISNKGLIWRTNEGELVMDGFRFKGTQSGSSGTNIWKFSVQDAAVVAAINKAAEAGARVKLTYEQKLLPAPWQSGTSYIVTKCEAAAGGG